MDLQNYYETVMELTHGIVVSLDLSGGIIHGNRELERMSGYSIEELAGQDWFATFIPKGERRMARKALLDSAHGQGMSAFAGVIQARDGDTVYVNWHLKPLTDSEGQVVSLLCVGQDVTDLVLREKGLLRERFTLMERNKELNCLYQMSLLSSDMDLEQDELLTKMIDLLPSAFQNPAQTFIRLKFDRRFWETPGFGESEYMLTEPVMINQERRGFMYVAVRDPSRPGRPFLDAEKELFATATRQVSWAIGKREARQARLELERQLRQSDRLAKVGQFSAGVAHEINEPLANILGFAELALQTPNLPEQVATDLDNIVKSSLHAREIIRRVMFFARQLPPRMEPIDLNETVEQGLAITESGARRSDITVIRDFDPDLPLVEADPQHIRQVVVNLAVNGIQALEQGGTLRVTTKAYGKDVYLMVEDDGPGMDREVLKQIFTPFYTTKEVGKGSGLGLSVIHGIVKAHKGFIQVDSAPGKGTRVEVAFPCLNRNKDGE